VAIIRHFVLKVPLVVARWRSRPALSNLFPLILDLSNAGLAPTADVVGDFDQM
jgi:hypothetical protein